MNRKHLPLFILPVVLAVSCATNRLPQAPVTESGVSQTLAVYRKAILSNLHYQLSFDIPGEKAAPIPATETLTFNWRKNNAALQIDFKEQREHLQQVFVNQKEVAIVFEKEHLVINAADLKNGANDISIRFTAGDMSLNRHSDFLYTLLVPDRARTLFPCFDQPDLKATFSLSLTIPADWQALAGGPLKDSVVQSTRKTYNYQVTDIMSTYLFSFAAGRFTHLTGNAGNKTMFAYHRETDTAKIRLSTDSIFRLHTQALSFLENYTQIPFPFKKLDCVAIPDFQYGGMEHIGAIQYKASSLWLDDGATQDQLLSRAQLIAHETSHMWFGDLVTMRWFNDVWMKEVFANFMADKICQQSYSDSNANLRFLVSHFPAAYSTDRTQGANPVRQQLDNLQNAGTLYGNIIYHKAPIVMRQLEKLMGADAFRDGLREYLAKYSYNNATWPELISILDKRTPLDLEAWNKVWVNETGRPVFDYRIDSSNGKITQLVITQKGEDGSNRIWPQLFDLTLVYPAHRDDYNVNMKDKEVTITAAAGKPLPSSIIFNTSGEGYGLFPVSARLSEQAFSLSSPVTRASCYINLYENMLTGNSIQPAQLLEAYSRHLAEEKEELNLRQLTSQVSNIYWQFITPAQRIQQAPALENTVWEAMNKVATPGRKKLLFRLYESIALSKTAQDRLFSIWQQQQPPTGVKLSEDDYTSLALDLAVRDYPVADLLQQQLKRIQNPDRKNRFSFIMPALSGDASQRDAFFNSLKEERNRENESWVLAALGYLHHPLRTTTSVKYLPATLDLLEEVQLTGDIFFPQSWLQTSFGNYQTAEAAGIVTSFLAAHPNYNPKLREKILQSADGVFRAVKLTAK
ncbi:MAG: M1 family aminopeptidase [Chitinophagaceae bacterium]